MAHFFADLFAERNLFGDVDTSSPSSRLSAARARRPSRQGRLPAIVITGSEDNTHKSAFALQKRIKGCEMKILYVPAMPARSSSLGRSTGI